jgi:hypothetical protein
MQNDQSVCKIILLLFGQLILTASAAYPQQQLTQTVTRDNKNCNAVCSVIDAPELNGNPLAIIFLTPLGKTADLNPRPVGAYYMYLKKWSVSNLDGTPIPDGAQYDVEYYRAPDTTHVAFTVGQPTSMRSNGACIDRPGLNRNSSAQIKITPASSPTRGAWFNSSGVKVEYSVTSLQWCIATLDGSPVKVDTVYNIAYTAGSTTASVSPSISGAPVGTPVQIGPSLPISTMTPGPPAPLTVVARAVMTAPQIYLGEDRFQSGVTVSVTPLCVSVMTYENPNILATDSVVLTSQSYASIEWTVQGIENGKVHINACARAAQQAGGTNVNILVLR